MLRPGEFVFGPLELTVKKCRRYMDRIVSTFEALSHLDQHSIAAYINLPLTLCEVDIDDKIFVYFEIYETDEKVEAYEDDAHLNDIETDETPQDRYTIKFPVGVQCVFAARGVLYDYEQTTNQIVVEEETTGTLEPTPTITRLYFSFGGLECSLSTTQVVDQQLNDIWKETRNVPTLMMIGKPIEDLVTSKWEDE